MKDFQLKIAQDLHSTMIKALKLKYPKLESSVEGASCRLKLKKYICYIDCSERNEKVEYSIGFKKDDNLIAKGYTHSKQKKQFNPLQLGLPLEKDPFSMQNLPLLITKEDHLLNWQKNITYCSPTSPTR